MCFTAKPEVVCELSTRYEAAISINEASCMGCSSLCRWDALAECRFVQHVQNTLPDHEQWISTCCRGVHAVAEWEEEAPPANFSAGSRRWCHRPGPTWSAIMACSVRRRSGGAGS